VIWILSRGEYSDYYVDAVVHAPDALDLEAMAGHVKKTIAQHRQAEQQAIQNESRCFGSNWKELYNKRLEIRREAASDLLGQDFADDDSVEDLVKRVILSTPGVHEIDYKEAWA
jgi:hypothetical protein